MSRTRADAVRNHDAVLAAADELLGATPDGQVVTVDAVASRAGVGKATVFRAFGDRAGLLRAVMASRSDEIRERVTSGPPPLGPGTPAPARVAAVLDALLTWKLANRQLSLALEQAGGGSPFEATHYDWWHAVLTEGLAASELTGDPAFTAHALLGAVRSDLLEHLLAAGSAEADLREQLGRLVAGLISNSSAR